VRKAVPDARFAVAAFKPKHAQMAEEMIAASRDWASGGGTQDGNRASDQVIEVHSGRTPELMHLATCCMACSGSVSMELLYYTKPTVILYWVSRLAFAVQRRFRKVKYITLVNLLATGELYPADLSPYDPSQPDAEKVLFPEYVTCEDKSAAVAGHVIQWLTEPAALARQIAALERLKAEVAHGGASARAAEYILRELSP
jgi:lipid-A-disaccharide synthase